MSFERADADAMDTAQTAALAAHFNNRDWQVSRIVLQYPTLGVEYGL